MKEVQSRKPVKDIMFLFKRAGVLAKKEAKRKTGPKTVKKRKPKKKVHQDGEEGADYEEEQE
jgi:hypothetical protein